MRFAIPFFLLLAFGCATGKKPQELSAIRFFLGINPDSSERHRFVPLYQESDLRIAVADEPFLDEGHVEEASIEEVVGGFQVRIRFDRRGAGLLQNATHRFRNRHLAIHAFIPEGVWLAAPVMDRGIDDGVLRFTPRISRGEGRAAGGGTQRRGRGAGKVAGDQGVAFLSGDGLFA